MLSILELLASEAPPAQVEGVARRFGSGHPRPDGEAVRRLEQAGSLALRVHALLARRQRREAELSALVDTARDLILPHRLDALLETITRRTRSLFGVDISYISFRDAEADASVVRTAEGHASALTVGYRVPHHSGLGDAATERGVPIWTPDYLSDTSFRHTGVLDHVVRAEGIRAIIAAPLAVGGETFGVLYAADRNVRHFSVGDVSLMSSLGGLAAATIEKARALERVRAEVVGLADVRRLAELHSRLIDLALGGGSLQTLTAEVAEALDGAVLVRDMEHRGLASVGRFPEIDESDIRAAVRSTSGPGTPVAHRAGSAVWAAPVMAGGEALAVLLLHPREPLDDPGGRRMALAAQAVAVLLQVQRSEATAASPFRDELFDDLLAVERRPLKQLELRANRLGIDHEQPFVVVVVRPGGGATGRTASWAASYARRMGGLRSIRRGCVSLLLPVSSAPAPGAGGGAGVFARAVCEQLTGLLGHPATVGAGGPVLGLGQIRGAHQEAMRCLEALVALGSTGTGAAAEDLGFLGVLLSDDRDVAAFVESTVGPVLDYDAERLTDLTRTLDAFFVSGASPTKAAELLHVHPNTVSRRLERVTDLLGADWSKPEKALEVQLALRLHRTQDVLRQQRPGDRAADSPAQADSSHTSAPPPYGD
ncbi:helix-turn-helix domain-containing protein [Streptomyces sp. NBC_01498]|uniref:helix-turn-helix domain-containing protein n=1 Tax=Streptomyces sp. NBC_01498 TaxID=2975870 RepID=UPI002E7B5F1C|nr:helix-turn-helix domain-containing protein [Streptomyces sp. NBC_01498]WTL23588.1 helix-turn-helix domain-containing protein [Streptomyces sp. NBC_01498]